MVCCMEIHQLHFACVMFATLYHDQFDRNKMFCDDSMKRRSFFVWIIFLFTYFFPFRFNFKFNTLWRANFIFALRLQSSFQRKLEYCSHMFYIIRNLAMQKNSEPLKGSFIMIPRCVAYQHVCGNSNSIISMTWYFRKGADMCY